MELIVQPADGITPILEALDSATERIDITIFRLDLPKIVAALGRAVERGVTVRALVAHTNSKGEKALRKVETKLLDAGVVVSRSGDDLPRYHGKLLTVDGDVLYLFGFNYTKLDIQKSRSFGLIIEDDEVVREATRLFDSDLLKQDYTPQHPNLVVSPDNARERLSAFIEEAKHELLIYDGRLSDKAMIRLLESRAKAGVDVRVLGCVAKHAKLRAEKLPRQRLHIRAIVRDGERAFVGSQSLRKMELDERREVGMLIGHRSTVKRIAETFEEDWALTGAAAVEEAAVQAAG